MTAAVPEPTCPAGMIPHRDRISEIVRLSPIDKVAAICVDNKPGHIAYYLQELAKYKEISIVFQAKLTRDTYLIKITKHAVN